MKVKFQNEESSLSFKQLKPALFKILHLQVLQNLSLSPLFYYLITAIETFQLLWFVLHPRLNLFSGQYMLGTVQEFLKMTNFQQYTAEITGTHSVEIIGISLFLLLQCGLLSIAIYSINTPQKGSTWLRFIRKITNLLFLIAVKLLTLPLFALVMILIDCNRVLFASVDHQCYDITYIVLIIVACLAFILLLTENVIYTLLYNIKNPLSNCYLAEPNRYYEFGKLSIKILCPLYFVVDSQLQYFMAYLLVLPAILGAYIFFFRFLSIHSYEQKHFYVVYFMEIMLVWFAVNNVITVYIPDKEHLNFVYSVACAIALGLLMVKFEQFALEKFVLEGLQGKSSKPNIEKLTFVLIDKFLFGSQTNNDTFYVYRRHLNLSDANAKPFLDSHNLRSVSLSTELAILKQQSQRRDVYCFLLALTTSSSSTKKVFSLLALRCFLLMKLGKKAYAIHQALCLQSERKLSLSDEFMLYQFYRSFGECSSDEETVEQQMVRKMTAETDFRRYYQFTKCQMAFEVSICKCVLDYRQYWQQLCENEPSVEKIRSLSLQHYKLVSNISRLYKKLMEIYPHNRDIAEFYLHFVVAVGNDVEYAIRLVQENQFVRERSSKKVSSKENDIFFEENEKLTVITLKTVGESLGLIRSCNSQIKASLGYEREELLGKNVIKIMPNVYASLHDSFLREYIKSDNSCFQFKQKYIYALQKEGFLIKMCLTTRIIIDSEGMVSIVGFLKKQPLRGEGILLIDLNGERLLGINRSFMEMTNGKIKPRSLLMEQVKLDSLLLKINMARLERDGCQELSFEVETLGIEAAVDDEESAQIPLPPRLVIVQLKEIKYYQGFKLAVLNLTFKDRMIKKVPVHNNSLQSITDMVSSGSSLTVSGHDSCKVSNNYVTSLKQLKSGNMISPFPPYNRQADRFIKQAPIGNKVTEYIETNRVSWKPFVVKLVSLFCLISVICLSVYLQARANGRNIELTRYYSQLNDTIDVLCDEGKLAMLVLERSNANQIQQKTKALKAQLSATLDSIQTSSNLLARMMANTNLDMVFNSNITYSFTYSSSNGSLSTINETFFEALLQYIQACSNFLTETDTRKLSLARVFVLLNGLQVLPKLTLNSVTEQKSFFRDSCADWLLQVSVVKGLIILIVLCWCVFTIWIVVLMDSTNDFVSQIYSTIKLTEVSEILLNCQKFFKLSTAGITLQLKERQSRCATVLARTMSKKYEYVKKWSQQKDQSLPLISSLLAKDHVELTMVTELKSRAVWTLAIVLCLLVIAGLAIYRTNQTNGLLIDNIDRLQAIGEARKHLLFIELFLVQSIIDPEGTADSQKRLTKEIDLFYSNSDKSYVYLGDPSPVLKKAYGVLQSIKQYLSASPPPVPIMQALPQLRKELQIPYRDIVSLDSQYFYPEYQLIISNSSGTALLMMVLLCIFFALGILLSLCLFVRKVERSVEISLGMVKMLALSIFRKNAVALKMLSGKFIKEPAKNPAEDTN